MKVFALSLILAFSVASIQAQSDLLDVTMIPADVLAAIISNFNTLPVCPIYVPRLTEVQESDVKCYLYTKTNPTTPTLFTTNNMCQIIDNTKNLKVLTHGWTQNGNYSWILKMKDTYLSCKDCQVLICDWSARSVNEFTLAAQDVEPVGIFIGKWLSGLATNCGLLQSKMHCVGHSMGSHVCSSAGKTVESTTGAKIARISGIDPGGPCFDQSNTGLWKNDALMVDILHTDAGYLGTYEQRGQIDFYPNGGSRIQPSCPADVLNAIITPTTPNVESVINLIACSHMKAPDYWTRSICTSQITCNVYGGFPLLKNYVFGENCAAGSQGRCYFSIY